MTTHPELEAELGRRKFEQPFHPFDIVTRSGERVYVGGQWLFAFAGWFVHVRDVRNGRDRGREVLFKEIAGLETHQ